MMISLPITLLGFKRNSVTNSVVEDQRSGIQGGGKGPWGVYESSVKYNSIDPHLLTTEQYDDFFCSTDIFK